MDGSKSVSYTHLDVYKRQIDGISVTATRQSGEIVDLLTKAKYGFKTISGKTVFISNDPQILLDAVDESDPIVEVDVSMSGTVYDLSLIHILK